MNESVAVFGGGAWGSALALSAAAGGGRVTLWVRRGEVAAEINGARANSRYLPGVRFVSDIRATTDLGHAAAAEILLLVVPAQHLRALCRALARVVATDRPLVLCAKGVELASGLLMSEVVAAELPENPLAVLSGPTFAAEVARGLPTAVTLACPDPALGERLITRLGRPHLRPYYVTDMVGAEVGGAVKNVLAIACGIVAGRGLGDNARAALITRGLAEMMRLGRAKGARPETLMGLSGLGDLVLTCTAGQSRNYALGLALGQGGRLADLLAARPSVVEGVPSAAALAALTEKLGVEMPIVAAVAAILHQGADITRCIESLLARPFAAESETRTRTSIT